MQSRHRIPTIFNLSMVDVLCCALGCVILLWLVYFKEARERSIAAGKTNQELTAVKLKLDNVLIDLASAHGHLATGKQRNDYLRGQLSEITSQRDQILSKWEASDKAHQASLLKLKDLNVSIAGLQKTVKDLETLQAAARAMLAQKSQEYGDLAKQFLGATQNVRELEKTVGDQKDVIAMSAAKAAQLTLKLADAEKNAKKLEEDLLAFKLLSKDYSQQLAKTESRAMKLEGELDQRKLELLAAAKRLDDLAQLKSLLEQSLAVSKLDLNQRDKALALAKSDLVRLEELLAAAKNANQGLTGQAKLLTHEITQLRSAADNRFAGIEMTGSRVVFLVDMSGSMRMKDYYVEDPNKWPLVCEILGKLMQSIPDLKEFQIILFSDKLRYPLANAGKWHEFRGPGTIKNVVDAVRSEVPQNETNMSAVFDEAFKYRALGMDTIYLLSDGLPNAGDGLPPGAEKLSETDRSTILAKYIRDRLKSTWNEPFGRWAKQRVRINAVGFYFDSPDVGAFLWALARDNDGGFVGLSKP